MRISLILTGKTKKSYIKEGLEEYLKRIKRYVPLKVELIADLKVTKKTSKENVKSMEGQNILQRIKVADFVILLDEGGQAFNSEGFAKYLSGLEGRTAHTVFIVGGAYGFSDQVYQRANAKVSLSEMTFSHQLVRLIFTEQLYRAYSILNGEPYHHK
jgi:23S rRNA (pseudouridine1915-N3)-methyltransferase